PTRPAAALGPSRPATFLPAAAPASAPTAPPTSVPIGPSSEPTAAPATAPPVPPTPTPTGWEPGAPVIGSRLRSRGSLLMGSPPGDGPWRAGENPHPCTGTVQRPCAG